MTRPAPALSADEQRRVDRFEAAPYPPEVAVCRDAGCEVCPPRAPARSASPAPDETEVERLRRVLAALVEAVSRGDEYGLPEAYRGARAALAARVPAEDTAAADVTECPDCGQTGRYEGRVLIRGRGVYTCPEGHRWQDLDETPSTKGIPL